MGVCFVYLLSIIPGCDEFIERKIEEKGYTNCIATNTNDPLGKAIVEELGEDETLDGIVVSVNVTGQKY